MAAFLLSMLFAVGGLVAAGSILATVQRYGGAARALRHALRHCPDTLTVRYSVTDTRVTGAPNVAKVIRPRFPERRLPRPAQLRAAA